MAEKRRFATGDEICQAPMLMPCDHCGGVADYVRVDGGYRAICSKCGMQTKTYHWASGAGKDWNARITTHARVITLQELVENRGANMDAGGLCACWLEPNSEKPRAVLLYACVSMDGTAVIEFGAGWDQTWEREKVDAEGIRWRLWTMKPTEEDMQREPWGKVEWNGGPSEEARAAAEALRREIEDRRRALMQKEAAERRKVCAYCEHYHVPPAPAGAPISPAEAVCKKDGHKINSPSGEGCTEWKDYQDEGRS